MSRVAEDSLNLRGVAYLSNYYAEHMQTDWDLALSSSVLGLT